MGLLQRRANDNPRLAILPVIRNARIEEADELVNFLSLLELATR
jgi:hypothetical protein